MGNAPAPVEWKFSETAIPYDEAVAAMEQRVGAIRAGEASELVWMLEHPPIYTAGTSAAPADLLNANRFPVHRTGRGGRYTYHGPGQRVAYVMLDLQRRGPDLRRFVCDLEDWMIATLGTFNVTGERHRERIGIWVDRGRDLGPGREDKIAAIGVRVRRWVTYHGIAINVDPDLSHFSGILPCGIDDDRFGVTSLRDLGVLVSMTDVDSAMMAAFAEVFGA